MPPPDCTGEGPWLVWLGPPASLVSGAWWVINGPAGVAAPTLWLGGQGRSLEEGLGEVCWAHRAMAILPAPQTSYSVHSIQLNAYWTLVLCARLPAPPSPELTVWWRKQIPNRSLQCRVQSVTIETDSECYQSTGRSPWTQPAQSRRIFGRVTGTGGSE